MSPYQRGEIMRKELKKARKEAGLSVEEISTAVGISTSFYYKIESGRRNPTISLAAKIAKLLDRKVEQIFLNDLDAEEPANDKKQIRCMNSFCFDMGDICCKSCRIKKCMYECNFINEAECKHQI